MPDDEICPPRQPERWIDLALPALRHCKATRDNNVNILGTAPTNSLSISSKCSNLVSSHSQGHLLRRRSRCSRSRAFSFELAPAFRAFPGGFHFFFCDFLCCYFFGTKALAAKFKCQNSLIPLAPGDFTDKIHKNMKMEPIKPPIREYLCNRGIILRFQCVFFSKMNYTRSKLRLT